MHYNSKHNTLHSITKTITKMPTNRRQYKPPQTLTEKQLHKVLCPEARCDDWKESGVPLEILGGSKVPLGSFVKVNPNSLGSGYEGLTDTVGMLLEEGKQGKVTVLLLLLTAEHLRYQPLVMPANERNGRFAPELIITPFAEAIGMDSDAITDIAFVFGQDDCKLLPLALTGVDNAYICRTYDSIGDGKQYEFLIKPVDPFVSNLDEDRLAHDVCLPKRIFSSLSTVQQAMRSRLSSIAQYNNDITKQKAIANVDPDSFIYMINKLRALVADLPVSVTKRSTQTYHHMYPSLYARAFRASSLEKSIVCLWTPEHITAFTKIFGTASVIGTSMRKPRADTERAIDINTKLNVIKPVDATLTSSVPARIRMSYDSMRGMALRLVINRIMYNSSNEFGYSLLQNFAYNQRDTTEEEEDVESVQHDPLEMDVEFEDSQGNLFLVSTIQESMVEVECLRCGAESTYDLEEIYEMSDKEQIREWIKEYEERKDAASPQRGL